jgi:D-inositol-3-phosphate glycosyltransferase
MMNGLFSFPVKDDVRGKNSSLRREIEVGLLTGGQDRHYAFGLATALVSKGVSLDLIGSDEVDSPELHATPNLTFLNFRKNGTQGAHLLNKIFRVLSYYVKLIRYAAISRPKVFHILWNNKFQLFDRTLLMLYYRLLRKKIVFTAHNVNAGRRDSADTFLNRLSLRIQYRLSDSIFVHTEKMKRELHEDFGVSEEAITVIPYGINNAVPDTDLTPSEARQRLGIGRDDKVILFFGAIVPYKGLDLLVSAFHRIANRNLDYRLVIAGRSRGGPSSKTYLEQIQQTNRQSGNYSRVIQKIEYIPDEETEVYFKAADVIALPYTEIFQSGILFLAYSFGLPVVASDVGSFKEDIIEGRTGFLCRRSDPIDLAAVLERYFESDLFKNLTLRRQEIKEYAYATHSWDAVADITRHIYDRLLE